MADAFERAIAKTDRIIELCEKLFVELSKVQSRGAVPTEKLRAGDSVGDHYGRRTHNLPHQEHQEREPHHGLHDSDLQVGVGPLAVNGVEQRHAYDERVVEGGEGEAGDGPGGGARLGAAARPGGHREDGEELGDGVGGDDASTALTLRVLAVLLVQVEVQRFYACEVFEGMSPWNGIPIGSIQGKPVLRGGQWSKQEAAIVVPGDIVRIKLGDIVPTDARFLEGDPLKGGGYVVGAVSVEASWIAPSSVRMSDGGGFCCGVRSQPASLARVEMARLRGGIVGIFRPRYGCVRATAAVDPEGIPSGKVHDEFSGNVIPYVGVACFGAILFGYHLGVVNGALEYLSKDLGIAENAVLQGWVVSTTWADATVGSFTGGALADKFGRTWTYILDAIPLAIGAFLSATAPDVRTMNIGRLLAGIGIGISYGLVALYISEISPTEIHGALGSVNQFFICIGILAAWVAGSTSISNSADQMSDASDGDVNQGSASGNMDDMYGGLTVNSGMDSLPERSWRLFADLLENTTYELEILTPVFPHLFVPIWAAAGAGRSAAALIQAATRSCFYAGFAVQRNFVEESSNTDIEGVDSSNTCYGGTAALLNCVNWVESKSWDGRYGLVVCTDSAVYAEGPARSTGGAAAIAMLIGPNAPISFENKCRASHMAHVYDFYKPDLASEYPVVDGKLSQTCYRMALDSCYRQYCTNSVDNDAKEKLQPFANLTSEESYQSRDLEKASQQVAKHLYDIKVQPSTLLPKQIGNMYTASLYAALASVIYNKHDSLGGQRIVMFSYGSGLTSTMFLLKLHEGQHPFSLKNIASVFDVTAKLESRHVTSPEKFVETLKLIKPNPKDEIEKQQKEAEFAAAVLDTDIELVGGSAKTDKFMSLSDAEHGGKMRALEGLLSLWTLQGDKILLFSYSIRMLDILVKFLIRKGYCFSRFDGTTSMNARQSLVEEFNSSYSKQLLVIGQEFPWDPGDEQGLLYKFNLLNLTLAVSSAWGQAAFQREENVTDVDPLGWTWALDVGPIRLAERAIQKAEHALLEGDRTSNNRQLFSSVLHSLCYLLLPLFCSVLLKSSPYTL